MGPVEKYPLLRTHPLTKRIVMAMGLFGSMEVLGMLCSVVRTKLVALWIGAAGVGILGLYGIVVEMICALAQLGVRTSAVRDISMASGEQRPMIVAVVRRCGLWLAGIGALTAVALSPLLSWYTFGDFVHSWAFVALSVVVFLNIVVASESAVLQGSGLLKRIARASAWGVTVSLVVSVPVIYYWRIDGVVPVLLIYSVVTAVAYWLNRAHVEKSRQHVTNAMAWNMASGFVKLGAYITVSEIVTWLVSYIVMSYINHEGGERAMGLYQSGYTLTVRYLGVVFTALGVEYFPRISAAAGAGWRRVTVMMRHQLRFVLLVVTSLASLMCVCAPWVVRLLYSGDFAGAVPMVVLAAPGVVFRGVSWCMAFVILAKGDGRMYLMVELVSGVLCLLLNVVGYRYGGIAGAGLAFTVWYAAYAVLVWLVLDRSYGIKPGGPQMVLTLVCAAAVSVVSLAAFFFAWWVAAACAVAVCAVVVSVVVLRRRR